MNPIQNLQNIPNWVWLGAALAGAYVLFRPRDAASGAVGVAGDVAAGVLEGAGSAIKNITVSAGTTIKEVADGAGDLIQTTIEAVTGIPKTDKQKCDAALSEGRTFDASLYCPAGTFISETVKDFFDLGKSATPTVIPKKSKPVATAPGGGFISTDPAYGPTFSDVVNDPYGLGVSMPNYFLMDSSNENERSKKSREITVVGGIRG